MTHLLILLLLLLLPSTSTTIPTKQPTIYTTITENTAYYTTPNQQNIIYPLPYESVPLIIVTKPWMNNARKLINLALTRRSNNHIRRYDPEEKPQLKIVVVILLGDVPLSFQHELYNTENLILIRNHLPTVAATTTNNNSTTIPTSILIYGLKLAIQTLPHLCFLLIHPNDDRQHVTFIGEKKEYYFPYYSIVDFDCRQWSFPTRFESTPFSFHEQHKPFLLLLPPSATTNQTSSTTQSILLLQPTLNPTFVEFFLQSTELWKVEPIRKTYSIDYTYEGNELDCYKNHIRRTPQQSNNKEEKLHYSTNNTTNQSTILCLALPIRGKPTTLLDVTIPGFMETIKSNTVLSTVRLYIGWEEHDPYFMSHDNRKSFIHSLQHIVTRLNKNNNAGHRRCPFFDIIIRRFPNVERDLVYIWNMLFLEGYENNCDYFMHITDDVDFRKTPGIDIGWQDEFISLLRAKDNFALAGSPLDVNTMPLVHRTHLEMMSGWFYSRVVHNLMCDTSIWTLYRSLGLMAGPLKLKHWINLSDKGEEFRRYKACPIDHYYESQTVEAPPRYPDLNIDLLNQYAIVVRNKTYARIPDDKLQKYSFRIGDDCRLEKAFNPNVFCRDVV
jgi:hypothetical protein